jgi:hypothetical protein
MIPASSVSVAMGDLMARLVAVHDLRPDHLSACSDERVSCIPDHNPWEDTMDSEKRFPHLVYGKPEAIQNHFGITPENGSYIAGIVVFAGVIEYHLERFIWRINEIDPKGQRPKTDGKPVSAWIETTKSYAETLPKSDGRHLLETWCSAAESAFKIRNDIAHGVPVNVGGAVAFNRNPKWQGELRSREHTDFWADEPTLKLVRDAMAVLVRMISELQNGQLVISDVKSSDIYMKALNTARSILGELSDQRAYNPTFEKY